MAKNIKSDEERFKTVGMLLQKKLITEYDAIFRYLPPTVLARGMKIRPERFTRYRFEPALYTLEEIYRMADLFNYDRKKMLDIIHKAANK